MKYLRTLSQLNQVIEKNKAIIIIFVDPNEFMPAKSLLNYLFAHRIISHVDGYIYIWNIVDQQVYEKYQIIAFPQLTVLKEKEALFSFIGYNREKANQAIQILCKELKLGKPSKQLNKKLVKCTNNHEMSIVQEIKQSQYVQYIGGCFECDLCKRLSHFDKQKPTLHCEVCNYDICSLCAFEDVLI